MKLSPEDAIKVLDAVIAKVELDRANRQAAEVALRMAAEALMKGSKAPEGAKAPEEGGENGGSSVPNG